MSIYSSCIFASVFRDHGSSTPTCIRNTDTLVDAIEARMHCSTCPYFITHADVMHLQDVVMKQALRLQK